MGLVISLIVVGSSFGRAIEFHVEDIIDPHLRGKLKKCTIFPKMIAQ